VTFSLQQVVFLLRTVAFMVLVYLALGLLVEVRSTRPDSKVRAFFRILCSPVTRPVARFVAPGSSPTRVLAISIAVVGAIWFALIVLTEVVQGA
jgi:uncharacterized protein YggT (Ycf19 family)